MLTGWWIIAEIYAAFLFVCAWPWVFNLAVRGKMPVTVRLFSMFVFSLFLVNNGWVLLEVHMNAPDRMGVAVRLLAPMIFASFIGLNLVMKSLVKRFAVVHKD